MSIPPIIDHAHISQQIAVSRKNKLLALTIVSMAALISGCCMILNKTTLSQGTLSLFVFCEYILYGVTPFSLISINASHVSTAAGSGMIFSYRRDPVLARSHHTKLLDSKRQRPSLPPTFIPNSSSCRFRLSTYAESERICVRTPPSMCAPPLVLV